jgi:hypothetical protein
MYTHSIFMYMLGISLGDNSRLWNKAGLSPSRSPSIPPRTPSIASWLTSAAASPTTTSISGMRCYALLDRRPLRSDSGVSSGSVSGFGSVSLGPTLRTIR